VLRPTVSSSPIVRADGRKRVVLDHERSMSTHVSNCASLSPTTSASSVTNGRIAPAGPGYEGDEHCPEPVREGASSAFQAPGQMDLRGVDGEEESMFHTDVVTNPAVTARPCSRDRRPACRLGESTRYGVARRCARAYHALAATWLPQGD